MKVVALVAGAAIAPAVQAQVAQGGAARSDISLYHSGATPLLEAACLYGERIPLMGVHNIEGELQLSEGDSSFLHTCLNDVIEVTSDDVLLSASCMTNAGDTLETQLSLMTTAAMTDLLSRPDCSVSTLAPSAMPASSPDVHEGANDDAISPNASGDVHISTPDGLFFDYHGTGDYILSQSTDEGRTIRLHARQEAWEQTPGTSVNTRVAMAVGSDIVEFQIRPEARMLVSGTPTELPSSYFPLDGGGRIELTSGRGTDYTIWWPSEIYGDTYGARVVLRGDATIDIGGRSFDGGGYEGLIGNMNGVAPDDMRIRDGEVIAPPASAEALARFGDSWRVPAGESLFSDPLPAPGGLVAATSSELANAMQQTALLDCRTVGISDPVVMDNCIYDLSLTGEQAFIESAQILDAAIRDIPMSEHVGGDEQRRFMLEEAKAGAFTSPEVTPAAEPYGTGRRSGSGDPGVPAVLAYPCLLHRQSGARHPR